jgi:hypothetical protein
MAAWGPSLAVIGLGVLDAAISVSVAEELVRRIGDGAEPWAKACKIKACQCFRSSLPLTFDGKILFSPRYSRETFL